VAAVRWERLFASSGEGEPRADRTALHGSRSAGCWEQLVQHRRAASLQKPSTCGLSPCVPCLQETAACRIGAIETLVGTPSTTVTHRARRAQPSTPGVNFETEEPGWAEMLGWSPARGQAGGRKRVIRGEFHRPVPGHEDQTGASSPRTSGHSGGGGAPRPRPTAPLPQQLPARWLCPHQVCVYPVPSLPSPRFPRKPADRLSSAGPTAVCQPCDCPAPRQFGGNRRQPVPSSPGVFGYLGRAFPESLQQRGTCEGHPQCRGVLGSGAARQGSQGRATSAAPWQRRLVVALRSLSKLAIRQAEASGGVLIFMLD